MICLQDLRRESDTRVLVGAIHFQPEKYLDAAQKAAGIMVDVTEKDLPQPEIQRGKVPLLYYNPKDSTFWYEYADRPLTPDEELAVALEKQTALLEQAVALLQTMQASKV